MKKRIALLSLIAVLCAGAIIAFKLMGDSTLHRMQISEKSDELSVCNDKHSKQSPIIIKCLNKKDDYITETELEKMIKDSSVKSDEICCLFYIRDNKERIKLLGTAIVSVQSRMLNKKSKYSYGFALSKVELTGYGRTIIKKCSIGFELPEGDEFLEPSYIQPSSKRFYVINNLVEDNSNKINWECKPHKMKNIKHCRLQTETYLKSDKNYMEIKFQINEIQFVNGMKKYKLKDLTVFDKALKKND